MTRKLQFTLAQLMIAVLVIGYLSAFRELAVLLGIFLIAVLFVAPIPWTMWVLFRMYLGDQAPSRPPGGAE